MQHQDYTKNYTSYTKEWNKLCECLINKPVTDLAKLSIDTFNSNVKASNEQWNEFLTHSSRRPDELMSTQMKVLVETTARAMECMQQAMGILMESYSNFNKEFSNMVPEMTKHAASAAHSAATSTSHAASAAAHKMREKQ